MGSSKVIGLRQFRLRARVRRAFIFGALLFAGACTVVTTSDMDWSGNELVENAALKQTMPICGVLPRINCVVDGDTIWLKGEKIRLSTFNTPEVEGKCRREINLADQATRKLSSVLSSNSFTVQRQGLDGYDRRLAVVRIDGRDVADTMIAAGLAHEWQGHRHNWC